MMMPSANRFMIRARVHDLFTRVRLSYDRARKVVAACVCVAQRAYKALSIVFQLELARCCSIVR